MEHPNQEGDTCIDWISQYCWTNGWNCLWRGQSVYRNRTLIPPGSVLTPKSTQENSSFGGCSKFNPPTHRSHPHLQTCQQTPRKMCRLWSSEAEYWGPGSATQNADLTRGAPPPPKNSPIPPQKGLTYIHPEVPTGSLTQPLWQPPGAPIFASGTALVSRIFHMLPVAAALQAARVCIFAAKQHVQ